MMNETIGLYEIQRQKSSKLDSRYGIRIEGQEKKEKESGEVLDQD